MSNNTLFGTTIDLAANALDLRSRRHELILSNIANADTPGYKAFDLLVDEALGRQTTDISKAPMKVTHPSHFPTTERSSNSIEPVKVMLSSQATLRGDGNTVDMDREMSNLSANQFMYKASAQIVAKKFQGLLSVIQGGKG